MPVWTLVGAGVLLFALGWAPDPVDDLLTRRPPAEAPGLEWPGRYSGVPADDAPIEELASFARRAPSQSGSPLSERAALRLLDHGPGQPGHLSNLLHVLPETPAVIARVERILAEEAAIPRANRLAVREGPGSWKESVQGWLALRSPRYADVLEANARGAVGYENAVFRDRELVALARRHWARARPILERFAREAPGTRATYALAVMFVHGQLADAERDRARERLLAIARSAPRARSGGDRPLLAGLSERRIAIRALLARAWPGRDAWHLALFSDPSILGDPAQAGQHPEFRIAADPLDGLWLDGSRTGCPEALLGPLVADPDRHLPRVAGLLAQPGTERDTAAFVLSRS